MSLELPPELDAQFTANLNAAFGKSDDDEPKPAPATEPEGSTPDEPKAADAPAQEPKSPEPATESPSVETQPSPGVDADAIAESLIETDEARNLVAKYKAAGKSTVEAVREALKHSAPAYWSKSKEEAEKARAAKEPVESPSTPPPAPEPAKVELPPVPELQTIDTNIRALDTQKATVEQNWTLYTNQLTGIQNEIRAITMALTREQDFEKDQKLRETLAGKLAEEQQHVAYLNHLQEKYADIEEKRVLLGLNRQVLQDRVERQAAREAEIQNLKRLESEKAEAAEKARKASIHEAWVANLDVVMKEGDAIPADTTDDFKDEALTYLAIKGPQTGADVPGILREFKKRWDARADKLHRAKSAAYAAKKHADTNVNAPEGQTAVAPVAKGSRFTNDDELFAAIDAGFKSVKRTA